MSAHAPASAPARRLSAIDFVRGVFMLVIIAGHCGNNLDASPASDLYRRLVHHPLRAGTVGFALTSGVLFGAFLASRSDLDRIFARYRSQALRLLLVAHPLISLALFLAHRPADGPPDVSFFRFFTRRIYVTDILAAIFLVAPLVRHLRPSMRLLLGVLLLGLAREWDCAALGERPVLTLLREVLAGAEMHPPKVLLDGYPLLGITGMFLAGTWVGDHLGAVQHGSHQPTFPRRLWKVAAVCTGVGAVLSAIWAAARFHFGGGEAMYTRCLLYPNRFGSLFPLYLAATIALFAFAFALDARKGPRSAPERWCVLLGKTSLFTYVFQYVLAETLPALLGLQGKMSVPVLLIWITATFALTISMARLWNQYVKKV